MLKGIHIAKSVHLLLALTGVLCAFMCLFTDFTTQKVGAVSTWQAVGPSNKEKLLCDSNGVYIVSHSGNSLTAQYIIGDVCQTRSIKTEGEIKNIAVNNGYIYALSVNSSGETILNKYSYNNDSIYNYYFSNLHINSAYKFFVTNDKLYFTESDDENPIFNCYNIYGEKQYDFTIRNLTDYCINTAGDKLYIFSQNNIYTINTVNNSMPQHVFTTVNIRPSAFLCEEIIFDYGGNIIDCNNKATITTNYTSNEINGGIINNYYCRYYNGTIYGYNQNGKEYSLYQTNLSGQVQMCSYNNKLYLLSDNGTLLTIDESELSFPNNNNTSNTNNGGQSTPNSQQSKPQSEPDKNNKFSINSYNIDASQNIVWNIPSGTTISQFKNNITCVNYSIDFYNKDNVKKTSGKLGTNYTMVVNYNNSPYRRYTLSVTGDLTGEGSVNKSDVKLLSRYLMNSKSLTKEQLTAADCNNDGQINGADLLKIAKNNL